MDFKGLTIFLLLSLTAAGHAAAQEAGSDELYRWVDENGNVHYTATLPAEYSNRPYDIINNEGIVVRRVTDPLNPESGEGDNLPPVISEEERQRRLDRALLLKYRSEQEFQDAIDTIVDQLDYDRLILISSRDSLLESYRGQVRKAADTERAGNEVPPPLTEEIDALRERISQNNGRMADLDARQAAMQENFDEQMTRYRYLRGTSTQP